MVLPDEPKEMLNSVFFEVEDDEMADLIKGILLMFLQLRLGFEKIDEVDDMDKDDNAAAIADAAAIEGVSFFPALAEQCFGSS